MASKLRSKLRWHRGPRARPHLPTSLATPTATLAPAPLASDPSDDTSGDTSGDTARGGHESAPPSHTKALTRTASGAAMMGIGMIVSGLFGYVQTVAMTHMVNPSSYGIFVVVFTIVTFVGGLTRLGLDGTVLRFLPRYRAQGNGSAAAGLVRAGLSASLLIGTLCAVILFVCAPLVASVAFHSAIYVTPLREAAVLIPLSGIQGMLLNGLLALKAIKWQVCTGKVIEPVATPVLLVVFYLFGWRLEALIYAYVGGILISVVVGWIVFHRAMTQVVHESAPTYALRTWTRFGAALLFGNMTNSVIQSTDVLGVGAFSTAAQVALYRVADRVSALISLPIFALTSIFAPTIAELHAQGNRQQLANMFAVVTRWTVTCSLPIFLCCVIFAQPILAVFGKTYDEGSLALFVLAMGNLVNAGTGPVGNMVGMTCSVRVLWFNTALRLVVNVALICLLVPRYTLLGAAIASSLTIVVANVVDLVEVWWLMRLHPYRRDMLKPLGAGGVATLVGVLLVRSTHHLWHGEAGGRAMAYAFALVVVFTLVYAIALLCLGLGKEDRAILAGLGARLRRLRGSRAIGQVGEVA